MNIISLKKGKKNVYDLSVSKNHNYICEKKVLHNCNYRGNIKFRFKVVTIDNESLNILKIYHIGDRIGQLIIIPYPEIESVEVDTLSETERGDNGFGSSGK